MTSSKTANKALLSDCFSAALQTAAKRGVKRMKNIILLLSVFSLLGCVSRFDKPNNTIVNGFDVPSDQILLVVKVNKTEFTGYYPASGCETDECITVSFWFTHEADVLDVVKGNYETKHINFANLQHADYIDEIKDEWYIQLKEISSKELSEQLKVKYYVVWHDSKFQHKR
jgi:hypothetical protein